MSASLDYIYQPDVPVEIISSHDYVFAYAAKKVIFTAKYKQSKNVFARIGLDISLIPSGIGEYPSTLLKSCIICCKRLMHLHRMEKPVMSPDIPQDDVAHHLYA